MGFMVITEREIELLLADLKPQVSDVNHSFRWTTVTFAAVVKLPGVLWGPCFRT